MAVTIVLAMVAAACWASGRPALEEAAAPPAADGTPTTDGGPTTGVSKEAVPAPWEPGAPRRIRIPALDVDAPVMPVVAVDDVLVPPADAQQLGWWADGARPGSARGSVLVAGHTVHNGRGALDHLEHLTTGDKVVVRTDRGRLVYEVSRVRAYSKGRLADVAERVFSQEVPGRLVLITCEDWDGTAYRSNIVVQAVPAD